MCINSIIHFYNFGIFYKFYIFIYSYIYIFAQAATFTLARTSFTASSFGQQVAYVFRQGGSIRTRTRKSTTVTLIRRFLPQGSGGCLRVSKAFHRQCTTPCNHHQPLSRNHLGPIVQIPTWRLNLLCRDLELYLAYTSYKTIKQLNN